MLHTVLAAQPDDIAVRLQVTDPDGIADLFPGLHEVVGKELSIPRPAAALLEEILAAMPAVSR